MKFIRFIILGVFIVQFNSSLEGQNFIGLQLYSIRDSIVKNVTHSLQLVSEMGYDFVEPAGYNNGTFYKLKPDVFLKYLDDNNLKCVSSHAGRSLPDFSEYSEVMDWWDECIKAHSSLGVRYIIQPFMDRYVYTDKNRLKDYCDYFNEIGRKCKDKGIVFGFHNHDREITSIIDGVRILDFLIENTDPELVVFQLDLRWCIVAGINPTEYIKKYPGRFKLWHVRDYAEIGGSETMDFKGIWEYLELSGMEYGVVEVAEYNYDQFTSCQKSIDFINQNSYFIFPR